MLDIKFIRENSEKVKKACKDKQVKVDIDELLRLDKERRGLLGFQRKKEQSQQRHCRCQRRKRKKENYLTNAGIRQK
jgi:seryl-tRNA synthetase